MLSLKSIPKNCHRTYLNSNSFFNLLNRVIKTCWLQFLLVSSNNQKNNNDHIHLKLIYFLVYIKDYKSKDISGVISFKILNDMTIDHHHQQSKYCVNCVLNLN